MQFVRRIAAAALLCAVSSGAFAQYPEHPITIVSPFPPGGATDITARALAKPMSEVLGQSIVVINKPGAGTTIGAAYAASQAADGYTLLMAPFTAIVTSRFLFKSLKYDPDAFEPVGLVGTAPMMLLSAKARAFKNTQEAIAYAKENGEDTRIASQGPGTLSHLLAECLQNASGVKMTHIPYKGTSEAMPALINGDVDLFYDTVGTGITQVQAGKVDVLHETGAERMKLYPGVPTIAEEGVAGCEMRSWWALVAPQGTPPEVLKTLQEALQTAMRDESVRKVIVTAGTEPADGSADGYRDMVRADVKKIGDLIERAGITLGQ